MLTWRDDIFSVEVEAEGEIKTLPVADGLAMVGIHKTKLQIPADPTKVVVHVLGVGQGLRITTLKQSCEFMEAPEETVVTLDENGLQLLPVTEIYDCSNGHAPFFQVAVGDFRSEYCLELLTE